MQRYTIDDINCAFSDRTLKNGKLFVTEADAEAYAEERVRMEREEIVAALESIKSGSADSMRQRDFDYGVACALGSIRSRNSAPKPKLEKLAPRTNFNGYHYNTDELAQKVDECVEAIRELQGRK